MSSLTAPTCPPPPEAQKQAAIQAQWLDKTISDQVNALGEEGKITYRPGYAPPAATPTLTATP